MKPKRQPKATTWHSTSKEGFKCYGGIWGLKTRELWRLSHSCHIDTTEWYVVVRNRAELDRLMVEKGWTPNPKTGMQEPVCLVGTSGWLDDLWMQ